MKAPILDREIAGELGARPLKVRSLVLWPTAECNLACRYCYRTLRQGRMTVETALRALDWAADSAGGEGFQVQFAGGEPTLAMDVVEAVLERIRERGLNVQTALQTNGTRLDRAMVRLFKVHGVDVGLSLDGAPDLQEDLRGEARSIFQGLTLLAQEDLPVQVTAVVTAVNVRRLKDLALLLAGYPNIRGLALDPLVKLGHASLHEDLAPATEDLEAGIRDLHRVLTALPRWRRAPFVLRELERVRKARPEGDFCHACRGQSVAVDPSGRLFPCAQAIGMPELQAGTLDAPDPMALRRGFGVQALKGPCDTCSLQGRCPGDCPSRLRFQPPGQAHAACTIYRTLAACEARVTNPRMHP